MSLKKLSLDLGLKYTYRVFLYSSIFIGLYGFIALFFTLIFWDILTYKIPTPVFILGYYDVILICGIMIKMVKIGAEVNSYFPIHKQRMLAIKSSLLNFMSNYRILKDRTHFNSDTLKAIVIKFKELSLSEEQRNERIEE
mmetsp:Transcript_2264/g.2124  ORF Transcript_2264/g.2124 Transcript_2264/m.2124 type:complete len:140 (-) Transcript_2264:72-491(-)